MANRQDTHARIAERLAHLARNDDGRKVSHAQVADAMGRKRGTVSNWLSGHRLPREREDWEALAEELDTTVAYLRDGEGPASREDARALPPLSEAFEGQKSLALLLLDDPDVVRALRRALGEAA